MPGATDSAALDWGFDENEWDSLTCRLNRLGVLHVLTGDTATCEGPVDVEGLFRDLASAREARLRQASVLLLLTHPTLASAATSAIETMDGDARDLAMRRYMAAACLQRMARTRIRERFGDQPLIPAVYQDELGLPNVEEAFGKFALFDLAQDEQERYGYDAWALYRMLLDLFLAESRRPDWGIVCDSALTATA